MKYGIVVFEKTWNIGDDIQSYAAAQLLPCVDYYIEREQLDVFRPKENECVNTIMNAWFMHNKLGWPVSNCINPLYISMHFLKDDPLKVENAFLRGVGGEDLKAHAPIGCRDLETQAFLEENGISTYFSGCLTLTLQPKFPKTDVAPYVCLVDVSPKVADSVKSRYHDVEIKIISHEPNGSIPLYKDGTAWNERFEAVENLLSTYQNAQAVITSRLHCALPCLALGTPVLLLTDIGLERGRYDGLSSLVHSATMEDYISGNVDFSLHTPPANPDIFIPIRDKLIERVQDFIDNNQSCTPQLRERFLKYDTEWEKRAAWKNEVLYELRNKLNDLQIWRMKDMTETIKGQNEYITYLEGERARLQSILEGSRSFRFARILKSWIKSLIN